MNQILKNNASVTVNINGANGEACTVFGYNGCILMVDLFQKKLSFTELEPLCDMIVWVLKWYSKI